MNKRHLSLLILVFSAGCVPIRSTVSNEPPAAPWIVRNPAPVPAKTFSRSVRVAIILRRPSVQLLVPSRFIFSGLSKLNSREVDKGNEKLLSLDITVHDLQTDKVLITPQGEGEITVEGSRYKGQIELVAEKNGTISVINQLPLEDYVMGVLAGEIPGSWPMEALKAQAIAARTFAVYKQAQARLKGQPYDLESGALSQMYIGSRLVNQNIRQAVLQTDGEILTYKDQPIMAVFHSNCGGETTGASEVWGRDEPYLKSVSCSFGNQGPHYLWKDEVKVSDVSRKLRAANIPVYDIVQIDSVDHDESQRVTHLVLMDGDGNRRKINGAAFRMALGPDLIRSTRFDVSLDGDKMVFTGRGWGHGVGLCQEGAFGMAKAGYGAFDILRHYYYGVILDKMKAN